MKILIVILVLLLTSCAKVSVKVKDQMGVGWDIKYNVLFRQVEDVEAKVGDVTFSIGKAGNDIPISNEVIACLIAPGLCK